MHAGHTYSMLCTLPTRKGCSELFAHICKEDPAKTVPLFPLFLGQMNFEVKTASLCSMRAAAYGGIATLSTGLHDRQATPMIPIPSMVPIRANHTINLFHFYFCQ